MNDLQTECILQIDEELEKKQAEVGCHDGKSDTRKELGDISIAGSDLSGHHDVVASQHNEDRDCCIHDPNRPSDKCLNRGILRVRTVLSGTGGDTDGCLRDEIERTLVNGINEWLDATQKLPGGPLHRSTQQTGNICRQAQCWNRWSLCSHILLR